MWPFNKTIDASAWSIQETRRLLESFGGKIYSAKWVTNDKRIRSATLKTWRYAALTYGLPPDTNPVGHILRYWTASDLNKAQKQPIYSWVNINLENLISIKCGRCTYLFSN